MSVQKKTALAQIRRQSDSDSYGLQYQVASSTGTIPVVKDITLTRYSSRPSISVESGSDDYFENYNINAERGQMFIKHEIIQSVIDTIGWISRYLAC